MENTHSLWTLDQKWYPSFSSPVISKNKSDVDWVGWGRQSTWEFHELCCCHHICMRHLCIFPVACDLVYTLLQHTSYSVQIAYPISVRWYWKFHSRTSLRIRRTKGGRKCLCEVGVWFSGSSELVIWASSWWSTDAYKAWLMFPIVISHPILGGMIFKRTTSSAWALGHQNSCGPIREGRSWTITMFIPMWPGRHLPGCALK